MNSGSTLGATSSQPALATGGAQIIAGGPPPAIMVFDYWTGQTQRMWAGTSGWFAGAADPGRYLQFDAQPTAGNQLIVTSVSFNYGGAGIDGHIRAAVRYSVNNWSSSTLLAPALAYPRANMLAYTASVSAPPVASGSKFSLRIYPYAILNSVAMAPTFASHNTVVLNGRNTAGSKGAGFTIRKSTGDGMVLGTYLFNIMCNGPGGPYTGPNPVAVVVPSPGMNTVNVPAGSVCGVTELPPTGGNWSPPGFTGSGLNVQAGGPWEAKVGPVTEGGGILLVNNRPGKVDPKQVVFNIRKRTGEITIPGSYLFNIICNGPGGPYTGPNPVAVVLPSPGTSAVAVPAGSVCGVTELPPTGGNWSPPGFTGSGLNVQAGGPWEAKVGPVTGGGGTLLVNNRPGKVDPKQVVFNIRKRTGEITIPGSYLFNIMCNGPGGPYTGPNPVAVVLPSPGTSAVAVPAGSVCGVTELPPTGGNWSPPGFTGSGLNVQAGGPWEAKVGPVTGGGGTLLVNNRPGKVDPKQVVFNIRKRTGEITIPGTYLFNIMCNGPGGPYTGPNPVAVVLPSPGTSAVAVPAGSVCGVTELPPTGGSWSPPGFTGNGLNVQAGGPWEAKVGPVTGGGGTLLVNNRPNKDDGKGTRFTIGKRTGERVIPGTYLFTITCNPAYTGPNPVAVVLPSPGVATVNVAAGAVCGIVEAQPAGGNWAAPNFTGSGLNLEMGAPWSAKVGPVSGAAGAVVVHNRPGKDDPKLVGVAIRKRTGDEMVPGSYLFNISCNGPGGPYTGPNPVAVVLPSPGVTNVNVPAGSVCRIEEQAPAQGNWDAPTFSGSGLNLEMGGPWEAKFGPVNAGGGAVMVNNRPAKDEGKRARFTIRKRTGDNTIAGTYLFHISCTGPGGPYTGQNPVPVVLPSPGASTIEVPAGSVCTVVEAQPTSGNWAAPVYTASGLNLQAGAPWGSKVGPVNGGAGVLVVNNRPKDAPKTVRFSIRKSTGEQVIAGTYNFNIACSGPGGPYTGQNPVPVVLPSPGFANVGVPSGSLCTLVELPPAGGNWGAPGYSGSGVNVQMGAPWEAQVGPVNNNAGVVMVANRPGKGDGKEARFQIRKRTGDTVIAGSYLFTIACNGPNGPYNTTASVVLPSPGFSSVNVPAGSLCTLIETPPGGNWGPPTYLGSAVGVQALAPWQAKVGPVHGSGGSVMVHNRPGKDEVRLVPFRIRKTTGAAMVPGTYVFNLSCSGLGGPYTGPPVSVVLPSPGVASANVPAGSVCSVTEVAPGAGWDAPTFSGSNLSVQAGPPWQASVGPVNNAGGTLVVANRQKPVALACNKFVFTPNLNVGTMIPSAPGGALNAQTNNGTVEKYCYGDSPAKCAIYGGLYEWDEAMGYGASNSSDQSGARVRGICPAGHHIPSHQEWARYAHCVESGVAPAGATPLSVFQSQTMFNWMGSANPAEAPGTKMKIPHGSFGWTGSNASGFAALPGGARTLMLGDFSDEGKYATFWTATASSSARAFNVVLDQLSSSGRYGHNKTPKQYGMSVRCMQDY
ncbi:DUF5979 domain-containing protein [Massilia glaciei]|uniref:Uncharacterized protein n=1 Tax=Massilia glaciei TaxID=1524097 RepID=A0A2U2HNA7_9BURK|nr:DUF5979 domain-containing protein [Massilia glaciei]PWF48990.1 hypothetical protein C7C56_008875 [Massilia glaciei]